MKMRRKIVYILVCMLVFTTFAGAISSTNTSTKSLDKENANVDYSHTIFGEFGTFVTCEYCKYAHMALKNLFFTIGEHPFYYITYVYDKNKRANQRVKGELGLVASPTVFWDGDYRKNIGAEDTESAMAIYNTSIIKCGERDVADIDISLDVTWLGAVNNDPENGATDVYILKFLSWTNSEMKINVTVDNIGTSQYNGHLHVQVCDNLSSMEWYDTFNDLYSMTFLDYAFNENFAITGGGTLEDSTNWDGYDYDDGYGHPFKNITQDNTWVIATVFDRDNLFYSDETAGVRAGFGTDPKYFDVYFGNTTPPPKVLNNTSGMIFFDRTLEFNTTYYWKIVEWDSLGSSTPGQIWSFTTRGNSPPDTPHYPQPWNNSEHIPINTNLSWTSDDPDGDNVTYDIYLGKILGELELVEEDYTNTTYDLVGNLEFNTKYNWQIVAKDEWHQYPDKPHWIYNATGPVWNFKTQKNEPPYEPSDPYPPDGANDVLLGAILNWTGGDPNPGDVVTYDVYFGRTDPPTKKKSNQTQPSYMPDPPLDEYEDYYWKIVAWDSMGLTAEGDKWTFKTGENHKPNRPTITGPTEVKVREVYAYNFSTTDPDGQNISYYIEWGDETNTGWLGPYTSGTTINSSHSWDEKGKFDIRCKAKDHPDGAESDWGKLSVTVPKTKQSAHITFYQFLQELIQRFPLLERVFSLFPVFNRIMNFQ